MTETLTAPTVEYGAHALIVCDNLVRIYQVESIEVQALQGLDLLVDQGEMVAIVGQSGSGKSTLLNVLSGLDVPTAGAARVAGWDLLRMSHTDRLAYRRSVVGFVWQQTGRNLLPYLSAKENVMLPMAFAGVGARARQRRAAELLDAMGMGHMAGRRPGQLSGGEQQRVAIAVALANQPQVVFADEPTGELDSSTGDEVFEALRSANRDLGATVVVVTHDSTVSGQVQRTVAIRDGRTASEVVRRTHVDSAGVTQVIAEEYAVLDRAGRMQLPKEYRKTLGLKERVRLELEADHIGVWADGMPHRPKEAPAPVPVPDVQSPPTGDAAHHDGGSPELGTAGIAEDVGLYFPPAASSTPALGTPSFASLESAVEAEAAVEAEVVTLEEAIAPVAPVLPAPSVPSAPPVATATPSLHFRDAPPRPTPREQVGSGHPLFDREDVAESLPPSSPYTPRVAPQNPSKGDPA